MEQTTPSPSLATDTPPRDAASCVPSHSVVLSAALKPSPHDGHASADHSEAESTASSHVRIVAGDKRKTRRAAVTEEEDIAILNAIAQIQPHRALRGQLKHTWQRVADAVVAATGTHDEVTRSLCQRRYEILLTRFLVRRDRQQVWPANPTLRALIEEAVEERRRREEEMNRRGESNHTTTTPRSVGTCSPRISLAAMRRAFARADKGGTVSLDINGGHAVKTEPKEEARGTTQEVDAVVDEVWSEMAEEMSSTDRRSFVGSTLVAVMERLVNMEKTWLENAREERELKTKQLEVERERAKHATPSAKQGLPLIDEKTLQDSTTSPASTGMGAAMSIEPTLPDTHSLTGQPEPMSDIVHIETTPSEIYRLRSEVAALTASATASNEANTQLAGQISTLSSLIGGVQQETDVLEKDVAGLQALLRDAASLTGSLKQLRDVHQQHEQRFQEYVVQQDARFDALRCEVKKRHQLIHRQSGPGSGDAAVNHEHNKRLTELEERVASLDAPISELKERVLTQQALERQHSSTAEDTRAAQSSTETTVQELQNAIHAERRERHNEYKALLRTIERVAVGKAKLI